MPHHLDDAPYQYRLPKSEVQGQKSASDLREESIDASVDAGMLCGVCFELMGVRMLGKCDHPLCYVCGLRLRILWKNNACAICRTDLPKVILTDKVNRPFAVQETANLKFNRRLKAHVTSPQVEQRECMTRVNGKRGRGVVSLLLQAKRKRAAKEGERESGKARR